MLANELGMQQLQLQLGSLLCKRPADGCGHHHHQCKHHHLHTRAQQLEAKTTVESRGDGVAGAGESRAHATADGTFEAAAQLVLQHSSDGDDTEAAATEPQQVMAVRPERAGHHHATELAAEAAAMVCIGSEVLDALRSQGEVGVLGRMTISKYLPMV